MDKENLDILAKNVAENRKILDEHSIKLDMLLKDVSNNEENLDKHSKILNEHSAKLDEHSKILNEHSAKLDKHSKILDEHSKILNKHSKILDEHTKILNEHSEDLNSIKRTLTIIEDAVTNKIPALFDAYQTNQEKHDEFDSRLNHVEKTIETNSLKISILEDTSRKHSKQLAKLSY